MNAADTRAMIQLAREKDVFLIEVWMHFFPAMVYLHCLTADGAIGNVKYVNVTFGSQHYNSSYRDILLETKWWSIV